MLSLGLKTGRRSLVACLAFASLLLTGAAARAEDGYRLRLRYDPLPADAVRGYRARVTSVVVEGQSPTLDAIRAELADGSLYGQKLTGTAGVANTGSARNWTGHHFEQANWYAFGRLAWDPDATPARVADEWVKMALTRHPRAAALVTRVMLGSHEAAVDYMTPLGLHHIMWRGHHYGPAPRERQFEREDWNPVYYHRADANGLGFDRTPTGSNTGAQYGPAVRAVYGDHPAAPEKFLPWFHHAPGPKDALVPDAVGRAGARLPARGEQCARRA